MLLNFFYETLTFLTAPRKRYCLAVQAEQIRQNRQPPAPLSLTINMPTPIITSQTNTNTIVQEPPRKEMAGHTHATGFPEPLSPGE